MTTLHRVVIQWSGASVVGQAVTVLHYDGSNQSAPPVAALKAAFQAANGVFPLNLQLTFPNTGDSINDTNGDLTGVWTSTGGGTVVGAGPQQSAAGVGVCIGWTTGGIVTGLKGARKLRGRTFIVPLASGCYDPSGLIQPANLTTLQTLGNAIQASGPLAVWHRPTSATATNGTSYGVISNRVRNKVAFLSSRRD